MTDDGTNLMGDEARAALETARATADAILERYPEHQPGYLALILAAAAGVLAARQATAGPGFTSALMLTLQAAAAEEAERRRRLN